MVSFTLDHDGQKCGGAMPPSLKSGGATGPLAPGSAAYDKMFVLVRVESYGPQCLVSIDAKL